jgi:hypothetical protein
LNQSIVESYLTATRPLHRFHQYCAAAPAGALSASIWEGKVMTHRIWFRLQPAARLNLSLLALALLALPSFAGPVQAQSVLQILEGSWSDTTFGCEHPWRISVMGGTITFEVPFRKSSSQVSYYSTDEQVLSAKGNIIETVTISLTDDDIIDNIGDRFTYTVEASKVLIHEHRTGNDHAHTRCKGQPVADRDGVPPARG